MNMISNAFLKVFSTDVYLTIAPDIIHLKRKDLEISIKTVLFLSLDKKKPIIVGIGDEFSSSAANKRIDLFKKNSWNQLDPSKKEILSAFFKHAMRKIHKDSKTLVRPKIIVKNSYALEEILCGYQQDLIKNVLTTAGARQVIFED